ncbi:hypothetical protein V8C43DRAFT_270262 [Trichoderma afarasin]
MPLRMTTRIPATINLKFSPCTRLWQPNFKKLSRLIRRTKKDEPKETTPHLSPSESDEELYRTQIEIGAFTLANSSSASSISEDDGVEDGATSFSIEEK